MFNMEKLQLVCKVSWVIRYGIAQLSYGSRFHRRQFPYGRAEFKPDGCSRGSYVSIVIS